MLRILIRGLNTELKSFCPIFSTSLMFCLFLALQDLVPPIFWFLWVVWMYCWRFCQKNNGHLNVQKNRRYSNPGTSDFAYTLWLNSLIPRHALLFFDKFCRSVVAPWTNQPGEKSRLQFDEFKPKLSHFLFSWSRH